MKENEIIFAKRNQKWKQAILESEKKQVRDGEDYIEYLNKLQDDGQTLDDLNVLAAFCKSHEEGKTPEPWVMNRLHAVFIQLLNDGIQGGEPDFNKYFSIKKTDFNRLMKLVSDENVAMFNVYALVQYLFGLKHEHTASVIKELYGYPHDTATLIYKFKHEALPLGDTLWTDRMDAEMPPSARATMFLEVLKKNHPNVFLTLKGLRYQMKRNSKHDSFK